MNILIVSVCDLENDPRISRQINFLQKNHNITCIGITPPKNHNVTFLKTNYKFNIIDFVIFGFFSFFRRYELAGELFPKSKILKSVKIPKDKQFDLIIANDLDTLPFAFDNQNGAKILLDAHEYFPQELDDNFVWRVFFKKFRMYFCTKYLSRCDAITTVCDGIAEEYYRNFGVKPLVITNAKEYYDFIPSVVDSNKIKIIHHGIAHPSRKIENMIDMMTGLDSRFTLDLMLVPTSNKYLNSLKTRASDNPSIKFVDPVPMSEIVKTTNNYDIGLFLLEPINFNYEHALPNKFFEFIQARLMIAIGPSPEMAKIVQKYDLGIVANDFNPKTLADMLNQLPPEKINYYKCKSHESAYELSSAKNADTLENLVHAVVTQTEVSSK